MRYTLSIHVVTLSFCDSRTPGKDFVLSICICASVTKCSVVLIPICKYFFLSALDLFQGLTV